MRRLRNNVSEINNVSRHPPCHYARLSPSQIGGGIAVDNTDMRTKGEIWRERIEKWKASGLTQSEWCRMNDVNYKRFGYWSRKLRKLEMAGGRSGESDGYEFYEVSFPDKEEPAGSLGGDISERMKPELAVQFKSYLLYINHGVSQGTLQTVMEVLANA